MRFVFASYFYTPEYKRPEDWIKRVQFYGGILEALAQQHTVISIEQIDYEGEYLHNDVQYYFKRTSSIGRHFPNQLHQFIKTLQPDVVFIHGLHFPLQVLQLRSCLGSNIKIIVQHHAELPANGIKKLLRSWSSCHINAFLFASRDLGLTWVNRGNLVSSSKIYEVMEVSSIFYPINKQTAIGKTLVTGAPVFLWVGRLNQKKDPLNVVRAFLQFAQRNTKARLYMIYQTDELLSDIIKLLDNHPGICDAIVLIGRIPHHGLLHWYNSADFIISGSFYEGSGTAVCEAMSCGVFPILTDIPSFRMLTEYSKFGLLYEAGNQEQLLDCLIKTIGLETEEMRNAILTHYNANLSFSVIAGKISEIASLP